MNKLCPNCRKPLPPGAACWFDEGFKFYLYADLHPSPSKQDELRQAAKRAFKRAIKIKPDHQDSHYGLGCVLLEEGDMGGAKVCFQSLVGFFSSSEKKAPNSSSENWADLEACTYHALSTALTNDLSLLSYISPPSNILQEAVDAQVMALSTCAVPDNKPRFMANLGRLLKQQGKLAEAVTMYEQALLLEDNDCLTHSLLGNAKKAAGDSNGAILCFQTSVRCTNSTEFKSDSFYNLGLQLRALGDFEGAKAALKSAIQLLSIPGRTPFRDQPIRLAKSYNELGLVLNDMGKIREAIGTFRCAVKSNSKDAASICWIGMLLAHQNDTKGASEYYKQAIRADKTFLPTYVRLAVILRENEKYDAAIKLLEDGVQAEKECNYIRYDVRLNQNGHCRTLGDIYYQLAVTTIARPLPGIWFRGRLQAALEAEAHCKKALEFDDNNTFILFLLARLTAGRDINKAIVLWRKGIICAKCGPLRRSTPGGEASADRNLEGLLDDACMLLREALVINHDETEAVRIHKERCRLPSYRKRCATTCWHCLNLLDENLFNFLRKQAQEYRVEPDPFRSLAMEMKIMKANVEQMFFGAGLEPAKENPEGAKAVQAGAGKITCSGCKSAVFCSSLCQRRNMERGHGRLCRVLSSRQTTAFALRKACAAGGCDQTAKYSCGGCDTLYCSQDCQRKDWKAGHKQNCRVRSS
jgi:tetratricopeptide (TPR) repeat protein